jgi:hypothetical protein
MWSRGIVNAPRRSRNFRELGEPDDRVVRVAHGTGIGLIATPASRLLRRCRLRRRVLRRVRRRSLRLLRIEHAIDGKSDGRSAERAAPAPKRLPHHHEPHIQPPSRKITAPASARKYSPRLRRRLSR